MNTTSKEQEQINELKQRVTMLEHNLAIFLNAMCTATNELHNNSPVCKKCGTFYISGSTCGNSNEYCPMGIGKQDE